MVRLILGRAGSGKTTRLLENVRTRSAAGVTGQIFLVPEQFSLNAERALCRVCGNAISLSAEVLTFRNLATRVFEELGGCAGAFLDPGGRMLTMYLAVQNVQSLLRVYDQTGLRPEFLMRLIAMSDELKACRIDPAVLMMPVDAGGTLSDKLHDIVCITGAYDALMTAELHDPADRMTALANVLRGSGYFHGRTVYLDGFNGFTEAELDVLDVIFSEAEQVEIALCTDSLHDTKAGADLFSHVRQTIAAICRRCEQAGVRWEADLSAVASQRFLRPDGDLATVEKNLYDYTAAVRSTEPDGSIRLYEADSVYTECEAAAAQIKALLMRGWRQREIAVVTRDLNTYGRTAQIVFQKYGLTVFLDAAQDVSQTTLFRLLVTALEIAANGCSLARMLRLIKTGLAGITLEEADRLEQYAVFWNINGTAWLSQTGFTANPSGYGQAMDDKARETLAAINALRLRVAEPLLRLIEDGRNQTARARATALYAYAETLILPDAVEAPLWDAFCACLDQIVMILGETPLRDDQFAALFRLLITQYSVGRLPTTADSITVGDALRSRADRPRAVLVLGAADGVFPPSLPEDGILTQADRRRLADDYGIRLAPANEERVVWEQLIAYQTLAAPSEFLWLSWAKPSQPSYLINRIRTLLPQLPIASEAADGALFRTFAQTPCEELAAASLRPHGADALSVSARDALQDLEDRDVLQRSVLAAYAERGRLRSPETTRLLYGTEPVLTAYRVERFQGCRFSYFAQYGLKLQPDLPASFDAMETGNFLHYVLEKTSGDIVASGGFAGDRAELLARLEESARRHIDEYMETCLGGVANLSPRLRYTLERLTRTAMNVLRGLVDEFSVSKFLPVGFEVPLEANDQPMRWDAGGETVLISGRVDRIDLWEVDGVRYVRVVDYKSGTKNFSYSEIENGVGIQLLLYLFAVAAKDSAMRPAGVLYKPIGGRSTPLRPGLSPEAMADEARQAHCSKGILLDDDGVILAMEAVAPGEHERFLPVSIDGGVVKRSRRQPLVSMKQFGILKGHIARLLRETKHEIQSGSIDCNPTAEACRFCNFRRLCRFDPTNGRDFWRETFTANSDAFYKRHASEEMEV